jgi:hypothetical protein
VDPAISLPNWAAMASLLSLQLRFSTAARTGLLAALPVEKSVSGCRYENVRIVRSCALLLAAFGHLLFDGHWRFFWGALSVSKILIILLIPLKCTIQYNLPVLEHGDMQNSSP